MRCAWGAMLALAAASVAVPLLAGPEAPIWPDARTLVLTFALTLVAMVAGIGSLALRETLVRAVAGGSVDLRSAAGTAYAQAMQLRAWALCGAVSGLGFLVAWIAARSALAWPYAVGATALLLFHAPGRLAPR
jgi:hypothetical protein